LWGIVAAGLAARIALALYSDNIFHPDEIGQHLEPAHRLAFGYGFVTWEWRFGMRSWAIPGFIAGILRAMDTVGLGQPNFYIPAVRIVFCLISVSVIFSSYSIAKSLVSERAGLTAATCAGFWYELVYFAHKPMTDIVSAYTFLGCMALTLAPAPGRATALGWGVLAALTVGIRFLIGPAVAVLFAFLVLRWPRRDVAIALAAAVAVMALFGLLDYATWGIPFISMFNFFLYSGWYELSKEFGVQPVYFYFAGLAAKFFGIVLLIALLGLRRPRTVLPVLLCAGVTLFEHTAAAHKEYRFIISVIPLLLILAAIVIADPKSYLPRVPIAPRQAITAGIALMLLSNIGLFVPFPFKGLAPNVVMSSRVPNFAAYRALSADPKVKGVVDLSRPVQFSGGYYYLHQDVPLLSSFDMGFVEEEWRNLNRYASHLVCLDSAPPIPGFQHERQFDYMEIRKAAPPPAEVETIPRYTRDIPFAPAESRFAPNVRWRL
jgi:hypothetical protein